jgi:UrcA family protein
MKAILTAAWAAALLGTALPAAAAQPDVDTRTVKVDYSDLNLASPRGISTLQNRVSGAISQVCGGPSFSAQESVQQRACERTARSAAVRDVANAVTSTKQLTSATSPASSTAPELNRTTSIQQRWSRRTSITRH